MDVASLIGTKTGHKYNFLKSSGNNAIREALKAARSLGAKRILVQDQGGWLRYLDYPPKYGLEVVKLKTDYGIIDLEDLAEKAGPTSALLYENPAGYIAEQPAKDIHEICRKKGCLVIMDVTGCIGDKELCNHADIMVGSFGEDKPVNLGYGGFISSNDAMDVDEDFDQQYSQDLKEKLEMLPERLQQLHEMSARIKDDLKEMKIVHRDKKGINVVVLFKSEEEKAGITDYCHQNHLEYTVCPRYIRVMDDAISIEVKRLFVKYLKL